VGRRGSQKGGGGGGSGPWASSGTLSALQHGALRCLLQTGHLQALLRQVWVWVWVCLCVCVCVWGARGEGLSSVAG